MTTGALRLVYQLDEADGVFDMAAAVHAAVHLTTDGRWMVVIEPGPLADALRAEFSGVPEEAWAQRHVTLIGEGQQP